MKLNPEVLTILMVAPILVAIVFRKDFLFIWFQLCVGFIFETSTTSLENKEYFAIAAILNIIIALTGFRTSILYSLVFMWQALFTYLRMYEILPFSNGYFALSNFIMLCGIILIRCIGSNDERLSGK